ncbi:hypothetical protein EIP91_009777 [Steccherinum ochraceum]|uniref:Uncharacterized protein n=1 Tax=Steccherinum ochraceum TaxID=92696 RepID=A0A4R0R189_9APHY|nr:hypothetical protein EIP91_009777 [Steccherinum ochraceum]
MLASKYQSILTSLKNTPTDQRRTSNPSELLQYGLMDVETYNIKEGVPVLICGYIIPHTWMAAFARRNDGELCRRMEIDPKTDSWGIASHIASCIRQELDLRVNSSYFSLPGRSDSMILIGVASNMPGKLEKLAEDPGRSDFEAAKQRLQEFFEMEEEPKWFMNSYGKK